MEGRVGPGKEQVSKSTVSKFTVMQNFPLPTVTQNTKVLWKFQHTKKLHLEKKAEMFSRAGRCLETLE